MQSGRQRAGATPNGLVGSGLGARNPTRSNSTACGLRRDVSRGLGQRGHSFATLVGKKWSDAYALLP